MSDVEVLPKGWRNVKLKEICGIAMGQSPSSNTINILKQGLLFYQGKSEFTDVYPLKKRYCEAPIRIATAQDILMSVRAPVGPVNIVRETSGFGRGLCAIKTEKGINHKFIFFQLKSLESYVSSLGTGTTFTAINRNIVEGLPIACAPEAEQDRIVEKLEELLSDLDDGISELKTAQIKLGQYRQSLLKSAVDGSLTTEWRKQNGNKITETGEQLLARILKQRRQHWEKKKLAEFAAKDKAPPKNWQAKYPEPVVPDTTELPELPKDWVWASLDMLGDIVSGVTKGSKRKIPVAMQEVPYLRVANVQRGFLNLKEIKTILATEPEIKKYTLKQGDVLFNEGGDRDKLGRGWVWYGEIEGCIHQNHVFRMRPFVSEITPELVSHHGNTFGKLWFQRAGKQTTNLASINKGILQSFPVPLAPHKEQKHILDLLTVKLDSLDKQQKDTEVGLIHSDAQRKNILKDAFTGKLVPQDPNDEPASILLAKIKAERAEQAKQPKPKRTKRKSRAMKKMDSNTLKTWVKELKQETFTFAELQKAFSGDYEELKEALFTLLAEPNSVIEQIFDNKTGVLFQRIKG